MKRVLVALAIGTVLSGIAAAYAGATQPGATHKAAVER